MIVVLLPDSGRGYLTKVFNDEWLKQYGFATESSDADLITVGEGTNVQDGAVLHADPGTPCTLGRGVNGPLLVVGELEDSAKGDEAQTLIRRFVEQ